LSMTNSNWINRLLIAIPFAIAALLNLLMVGVEHLHLRLAYIARFGLFRFSAPWSWLVNLIDIPDHLNVQNPWIRGFLWYVVLLWIPAILDAVTIWISLTILGIAASRLLIRLDTNTVNTLKRRTTISFSIVVVAALSWFALKLCRDQIVCNRRSAAFDLRVQSIEHDANEKLSIGTKSGDVSRFFVEHGIPLDIVGSEAIGTLYTEGCGPLGCGTDRALIGVRVRLDLAGGVTGKPEVVGMYTDCL
jgi:hypothetical protein